MAGRVILVGLTFLPAQGLVEPGFGTQGFFFAVGFFTVPVFVCVRGTQGRHKEVQPISEMPNVVTSRPLETKVWVIFLNLNVVIFVLSL
ncbi:hypothetical protein NSMM_310026 [Nitrosomonas mobilis]|uniref:Uncharacterized protein n=1 Tax=Nitrosomonas mobilis TaxID=51642 RepID=A0A1G5SCL8_9PROT|nr:hypothetical protein NSMM_310026 [Nitrosomonas mobilis]